jgi:RNA polymerase I-specific transcription initiation factor RRN6
LNSLELSGLTSLTENLEKVAEELVNFLNSLQQDPESVLSLIISDLAACPAVGLPSAEDPKSPDLMKVYEQLVNKWIASLPLKVPNSARGSKFKIIRQMAVELCFSSVAISLENKLSKISIALPEEGMTLENSGEPATRESSLATFFSSQMSAAPDGNPELTLPTPTRTPSIYSHGTSASELTEDPAVSRLRQYAISLKPRPDFGQSKLLLEWPSLPGVDPASYSYEAVQKKAAAENSGEEGNHRDKREAARRKRRTERFLQRNVEAVSQPSFLPFGSQPPEVPHPDFSSQPVEELPMTQPDRGAFGSRSVKGKKKRKKHRTAGF